MAVFSRLRLNRAGLLFVVGIIVLGALVTGGIFLVKNHGEAVRRDQAVKIAEAKLKDQSKTPTSTQPITAGNPDNQTSSDPATTGANTATGNEAGGAGTVAATGAAGTSNTSALPKTGPDDVQSLGRTIIVAILALSVAFYVSSRRTTRTL